MQLKAGNGRELPTEKREETAGIEKPGKNCKANDKTTDREKRVQSLLQSLGQSGEKVCVIEEKGLRIGMAGAAAEEKAGEERREDMDGVKKKADSDRMEHTDADSTDDKSGAGVVAEGEKTLCLVGAYGTVLLHVRDIFRAKRIAARKADEQGGGTGAGDAVNLRGGGRKEPAKQGGQAEPVEKNGENKKGKKRRDDHIHAERERIAAARNGSIRGEDQGGKGTESGDKGDVFFH